jgi:hypothetical protein
MIDLCTNILRTVLSLPFSLRQSRLSRSRAFISKEEFIAEVARRGGDVCAASIIHDALQEWVCSKDFSPHPDDSLIFIYGVAEEELDDDLIMTVFEKMGVTLPSSGELSDFGRVDTPLQIAQLVSSVRPDGDAR